MLVCQVCHTNRQQRKALESQPLQFTGYETKARRCADCGGQKHNQPVFEYLSAFELMEKLEESREKIQKYEAAAPLFPFSFYDSAMDMMTHWELQGRHDPEIMQLLHYAAELEGVRP